MDHKFFEEQNQNFINVQRVLLFNIGVFTGASVCCSTQVVKCRKGEKVKVFLLVFAENT